MLAHPGREYKCFMESAPPACGVGATWFGPDPGRFSRRPSA